FSAAGEIILVNAEAERMFGYSRNELLGQSMNLLVPEGFPDIQQEYRVGYSSKARSLPLGAPVRALAQPHLGSPFPVEINFVPMGEGNNMIVIRDAFACRRIE